MSPLLWGDEALEKLSVLTSKNIKPLDEVGTRIIIVKPTDKIVNYIKTNQLLKDIEDTWWEILLKHQRINVYTCNMMELKKAKCPDFFAHAMREEDENYFKEQICC